MRCALTIILLFGSLLSNADQGSVRTPESLVTVKIRPTKLKFKVGETISVIMLLRAGSQGVYLSKMWAEAGGNISGFFLDLTNLDNKSVLTCSNGSDADRASDPDVAESLNLYFMFLQPNEVRKWRSSFACAPKLPGRYLIKATYYPRDPATQRVAALAKTKGLVLQDVVIAEPVEISIK